MYVVMNVLTMPEDFKPKMGMMFKNSAENMKQVPGCLEFQFLSHTEEGKQIVYTKWENKEAFQAWVESDSFKKAHGERRGGGENPATSKLETYEVVHHT